MGVEGAIPVLSAVPVLWVVLSMPLLDFFQEGYKSDLFNHSRALNQIVAVKQSLTSCFLVSSMVSSVPIVRPNSKPMLCHFARPSHIFLRMDAKSFSVGSSCSIIYGLKELIASLGHHKVT